MHQNKQSYLVFLAVYSTIPKKRLNLLIWLFNMDKPIHFTT